MFPYQQPAINTLREVEAFLTQNPTEIVTIIIEDYVHRPKGLSTLFANAGLDKYWFPVSKMPKRGEDWPTVTDMVQENHRLLVFTSVAAKEDEEGVAYQWRYIVENECEYHHSLNKVYIFDLNNLYFLAYYPINVKSWRSWCEARFLSEQKRVTAFELKKLISFLDELLPDVSG